MPNRSYQSNKDDDEDKYDDDNDNDDDGDNYDWIGINIKYLILPSSLGNRPHPSGGKPLFDGTDPRLQFTVSEVDPRIHFALVCGAKVPLVTVLSFVMCNVTRVRGRTYVSPLPCFFFAVGSDVSILRVPMAAAISPFL